MDDPIFKTVLSIGARDQLVKLFSYVAHYSDVVTMRTNGTECITIQATNAAHTVMVFAHVDLELFQAFEGRGEISLSVKPFVAILKLTESTNTFQLYYESAKMYIEGGMDQYSIPTMTVDTEAFNIPEELVSQMNLVTIEDDPNMLKLFALLKAWQGSFQGETLKLDMNPGDPDDFTDNADISVSMESDFATACKSFSAKVNGADVQLAVRTNYFVDTCKLRLDQRCIGYDPSGGLPLLVGDRGQSMWVRTFIAPIVD